MTTRYKMTSMWLDGHALAQAPLFGDTPAASWDPRQPSAIRLPAIAPAAKPCATPMPMPEPCATSWVKAGGLGRPLAEGDHVRILTTDLVAAQYPDVYRGMTGQAVSF